MSTDLMEFPDVGTAGIADSNLPKSPQLDELFRKALLGELPRSRALKAWEPDKLNETHLQIILLRAGGMRQRAIADFLNKSMGTNLTDATVSICCNHPDAVLILSTLVGYAADNVTDMATRIRAYAGEAVERNVQIMRTTNDAKLAARIGFDFLDRAGYGATQKVDVNKKVEHRVVVEAAAANNLAEALREAKMQEIPASFVMSGTEQLLGEGGGNSLEVSESQADSGLPVAANRPPSRAPLLPKPVRKAHPDEDDASDFQLVRNAEPLRKVG